MTLGDIQDTARVLLATRDTTNVWTDSILTTLANMAQRHVWRRVAGYNPNLCAAQGRVTYSADALKLDLETALSANIDSLLAVYALNEDADPSASNTTYSLRPAHLEEIDAPKWTGDPGVAALTTYTTQTTSFRFAMQGREIVLRPIPTEDVYLWLRYIAPPADMASPTDSVFDGELVSLHDMVLYRTLVLCATRSKESAAQYANLEQGAWSEALPLLGSQDCEPLPPRQL